MLFPLFRHFFEVVRFDFVVDEELKVWLMEVYTYVVRYWGCIYNIYILLCVCIYTGEGSQIAHFISALSWPIACWVVCIILCSSLTSSIFDLHR